MPTFRVFEVDAVPGTQDLLNEFLVNMVITTPPLTDIAIGSKLWAIGYTLARQQASIYYTLNFYRKQSYVLTATGKYLDLHGVEVGVFRKPEVAASGLATFSRSTPAPFDILIPTGTAITTPLVSSNVDPTVFLTRYDAIMKAGETEVTTEITCGIAGTVGNLPAGAVTRIESMIAGIQDVTTTSTNGGTEMESDESLRTRILTAWAARTTGTKDALVSAVLSVSGIRNVLITDPARLRVRQVHTVQTVDGNPQILLETKDQVRASHDISVSLTQGVDGLTLTVRQQDDLGQVLKEEYATDIVDGLDLMNKVNYWTKSALLKISSISLDENPYDDPNPIATDNEVVSFQTISREVSFEPVCCIIKDSPRGEPGKRFIISTYRQFRHNDILGQTEVTPYVEVYEDIGTYAELCERVNNESKILQAVLLDTKTATESLRPVWNQTYQANTVQVRFKPVVEILSPIDRDVRIVDGENGVISVGNYAANSLTTFQYRYTTDFGSRSPENAIFNLESDGSDLLFASAVLSPTSVFAEDIALLEHTPKPFEMTKMQSEYELVRGRVDIVPIPYALPMGADVLEAVVNAIEKVKPVGVEVFITKPSVQFLDVEVLIEVVAASGYSPTQFNETIRTAITNYLNGLQMGETAYVERIVAAANPMAKGLKVAHVRSPVNDITPSPLSFLRAGTIRFVAV